MVTPLCCHTDSQQGLGRTFAVECVGLDMQDGNQETYFVLLLCDGTAMEFAVVIDGLTTYTFLGILQKL